MSFFKLLLSIICYAIGFGTIIYYIDFFTGFWVPKSINTGSPDSLPSALLIDIALICLFGFQHTLMAREWFKKWFESFAPKSLMRSFYVLLSSISLVVLILFWQPIPLVIFDYEGTIVGTVLLVLYYIGWAIGLLSTFEIDHLELFGVNQALFPDLNEKDELKKSFFYRMVRHPIYLGWILIHWMTPQLTVGHLLLAICITFYIYIALHYEERDLIKYFGYQYIDYKKTTPQLNPLFHPFKRNKKGVKAIKVIGILILIALLVSGFKYFKRIGEEISLMKSNDIKLKQNQ